MDKFIEFIIDVVINNNHFLDLVLRNKAIHLCQNNCHFQNFF